MDPIQRRGWLVTAALVVALAASGVQAWAVAPVIGVAVAGDGASAFDVAGSGAARAPAAPIPAATGLAGGVTGTGATVSKVDQVTFQQQRVSVLMQELDDRMFHLSQTIRDLEPDDSARLVLAVQKSRQEMIVEQMKDVLALLDRKDLGNVGDQQAKVIAKLEELRNLLLASDLDLQVKLARLHALEGAIKAVNAQIKAETKLQEDSAKTAADAKKDPAVADPAKLQGQKHDQEANHKNTNDTKETVKSLGPTGKAAAEALDSAGAQMGGAEGALGEGKPSAASGQQGQAVKDLKKGLKELEAQRDQLLEEIRKQLAAEIIARLSDLLDRQVAIRQTTDKLTPRVQAGGREAILGMQALSPPEQRLAESVDGTIQLIQETQFSYALPPALESIQRHMIYVAAALKTADGDPDVVARERQIEADIADLIDAMKASSPSGDSQAQSGKPCNCPDKDKLLAELRIMRLLQLRVNQETKEADAQRAKVEAALGRAMRDKIMDVRNNQAEVRDAMARLHDAATGQGQAN